MFFEQLFNSCFCIGWVCAFFFIASTNIGLFPKGFGHFLLSLLPIGLGLILILIQVERWGHWQDIGSDYGVTESVSGHSDIKEGSVWYNIKVDGKTYQCTGGDKIASEDPVKVRYNRKDPGICREDAFSDGISDHEESEAFVGFLFLIFGCAILIRSFKKPK